MDRDDLEATIAGLLREYGAVLTGPVERVPDSVSNENYRAPTTVGPLFVRRHQERRTFDRLEREQQAIAWAGANGLPVARPLSTPAGATLREAGGRWWSVYPWLEGWTYQRGSISPEEAARLGAIHGATHRVLARHPAGRLALNTDLVWDTQASINALAEVEPHVNARGNDLEKRLVRRQRELLESGAARPSSDFAGLPVTPTHGDFHERNVLFDATGEVAAIVDWERVCLQPPAFEVLRAVCFVLLLEDPLLSAYLQGYRRESRLDEHTIAPVIEAWRQSAMHNTWSLREYFFRANAATRQFFAQEDGRARVFNDPAFRERLRETFIREAC